MNSTTESTSAHLSSVKELLAELDLMKNKGIGARDRLDFILDQGAELVEEFDLVDAFDVEARARTKRLKQLDELAGVMTNAEHLWNGGPILSDVKEAATKLFKHLRTFLDDTFTRERKSEIEMLSQLWDWAPDIRWLYPWMTAWDGPIYRPDHDSYLVRTDGAHYPVAPSADEPDADVKELAEKKRQLYKEATPKPELERIERDIELADEEEQIKEMRKLWPQVPEHEWEQLKELEHKAELEHNKVVQEMSASPHPQWTASEADETKADWEKQVQDLDRGRISTFSGKVIRPEPFDEDQGRVVGSIKKEDVKEEPETEEETERLLQDAWTVALREFTLDEWRFTKKSSWGENNIVLLWSIQTGEARLELTELGDETNVSLRILNDGRLWKHEEQMSSSEVKELDPVDFVKKALDA